MISRLRPCTRRLVVDLIGPPRAGSRGPPRRTLETKPRGVSPPCLLTRQPPSAAPSPTAVRRRDSPSVEVARHLLEYLLSGHFAPGDRIPSERQLAQALQVGRAGVREAIKSLNLLGLIKVRQGDGTYLAHTVSSLLPEVIEWGLLLGERRVEDSSRRAPISKRSTRVWRRGGERRRISRNCGDGLRRWERQGRIAPLSFRPTSTFTCMSPR